MINKELGNKGEQIAARHLIKNNYEIIERNWRTGRLEVDIIAKKKNEIIFVEVKTRNTSYYGFPENAVNWKKKKFLYSAANSYIFRKNIKLDVRFDIISIIIEKGTFELEHIEDAFFPMF